MSRRIFQIAAAVVLSLAALTPIAECFDHWDNVVAPANDTELRVTAWFAIAGLVLIAAKWIRLAAACTSRRRWVAVVETAHANQPAVLRVLPTCSPPPVPLRI